MGRDSSRDTSKEKLHARHVRGSNRVRRLWHFSYLSSLLAVMLDTNVGFCGERWTENSLTCNVSWWLEYRPVFPHATYSASKARTHGFRVRNVFAPYAQSGRELARVRLTPMVYPLPCVGRVSPASAVVLAS